MDNENTKIRVIRAIRDSDSLCLTAMPAGVLAVRRCLLVTEYLFPV